MSRRLVPVQEMTTHAGTPAQIKADFEAEFAARRAMGWRVTHVVPAVTNGSTSALLVIWEVEVFE